MKKLLRLTALMALLVAAVSCSKHDDTPDPSLDINVSNIAGIWKLAAWNNAPLEEGTYVYMELTRRDRTFTLYENLDSFSARRITGSYHLDIDEDLGAVIRGQYDYGNGDWRHRYIISRLTADTMIWIAKDDAEDVSVYERCEAIPDEILAETGAAGEE